MACSIKLLHALIFFRGGQHRTTARADQSAAVHENDHARKNTTARMIGPKRQKGFQVEDEVNFR
jgi:hypothetical protein